MPGWAYLEQFSYWAYLEQFFSAYVAQNHTTARISIMWLLNSYNVSPYYIMVQSIPSGPMGLAITKTSLFKYTENFTTKKWKFLDKYSNISFKFLLKTYIVGTR